MTDAIIKELEYQMVSAAVGEETRELVQGLRIFFADCPPRLLIAMAIFLGEEIAGNGRISPTNRQEYIETAVKLIHLAFDEARGA